MTFVNFLMLSHGPSVVDLFSGKTTEINLCRDSLFSFSWRQGIDLCLNSLPVFQICMIPQDMAFMHKLWIRNCL